MSTVNPIPAPLCSCGSAIPHKIVRRRTADDKEVSLWSDGQVTAGIGFCIRSIGVSHSDHECSLNVEAGWLVFGEIELYDGAEVARLVKCARRAVRQKLEIPRIAMIKYFQGKRLRTMKAGRTFRWV
jgi:hypothetical protein